MPAVFTFWQTKEDERNLWEYLKSTGEVIVWPDKAVEESQIDTFPLSLNDLSDLKKEQSLCVTLKSFLVAQEPRTIVIDGKRLFQMIVVEEDNAIVIQRPARSTRILHKNELSRVLDAVYY